MVSHESSGMSSWVMELTDRPDMSKNVIRHLADILVCLVDEATAVPAGVMDCIISQFTQFASVSTALHWRCRCADG